MIVRDWWPYIVSRVLTRHRPDQPLITGVKLIRARDVFYFMKQFFAHGNRVMLTYSVQTSTPAPAGGTQVLTVTANGGTPSTGPLSAGFTCNAGDAIVLTLTDVSASGVSSAPSAPYSFTAVDTLAPPATPVITGVTLVSD
jgi:hypothetical protein